MPRRILLLITDLEIGGTPTVVRELAVRLNRPPAVEVEVACLKGWGPVADQIVAAGVKVTALGARRAAQLPATVWRLARMVRAGRFDTVFSFLIHANAVAAAASWFCRGVRFLQSIQTTQPYPRWHWRLQRLVHHAAERVVVPSPSIAALAADVADVPAGKLIVIPNAVDLASFEGLHTARQEPAAPFQVGFIGRLDPIKRVPDLLEAAAGMPPGVAHVHIFGDGPERARIEAEVGRLGLEGRATLHGAVARPHEALASLDVLVLPSEAEGFGLVLIEAMAAGVPVVAYDVAGVRDVVRDGVTGLLARPPSPGALRDAIRRALEDNDLRRRVVANALEDVRRRFTWAAALREYRRVLGLQGDEQDDDRAG